MTEQADREYYEGQVVDPEDQLQPEDTLDQHGVLDVLDEGYSPRERRPRDLSQPAGDLDAWLAQEVPEPDPYAEEYSEDFDLREAEPRAGRLVAPDQGRGEDTDSEAIAFDVGIDGAGASAEEAAMHVVTEEEVDLTDW
jgi:hypothetical protein